VVALSAKGRAHVESLIPIAKKLEVNGVDGLPPRDLAWSARAAAHVCQTSPTAGAVALNEAR